MHTLLSIQVLVHPAVELHHVQLHKKPQGQQKHAENHQNNHQNISFLSFLACVKSRRRQAHLRHIGHSTSSTTSQFLLSRAFSAQAIRRRQATCGTLDTEQHCRYAHGVSPIFSKANRQIGAWQGHTHTHCKSMEFRKESISRLMSFNRMESMELQETQNIIKSFSRDTPIPSFMNPAPHRTLCTAPPTQHLTCLHP